MPDYHRMYLHLFNEMTKAINILQDAQKTTEEMFVASSEKKIHLHPKDAEDSPEEVSSP